MWKLSFRSAQAPQGVFQDIQREQEGVSTELQKIAWEIALWVRRRNVSGACQDPEHPREIDLSPASHTEATYSRRDFSLLASTPEKQKEYTNCWFWKWNLICPQPVLHFLFCWHRRGSIFAILWLICACYKYTFAWSSARPRLFDSKLEEQKWTQQC